MTFWRTLSPALFVCPSLIFAASKEIIELQRDLAQVQEQVRALQRSQDEKFAALQVLVQQALDSANKTSTSVAVLQSNLQQTSKDQQSKVVTTVIDLGSKMDSVTTDVNALRESVADISSQMGKLQQQMVDIGNAVRTIQTPAGGPAFRSSRNCAWRRRRGNGNRFVARRGLRRRPANLQRPLYQNANRDRSGGNDDLALQEYNDYLKYYGNTDVCAERAILHRRDPPEAEQAGRCPAGVRHGAGKISGQ